jgi:hypothetical protein
MLEEVGSPDAAHWNPGNLMAALSHCCNGPKKNVK